MIRRMHPPSPEGGGSVAEAERGDRGGVTRRFSFTPPRRLRSLRSLRRRPSPSRGPLRNSEQEESNRSWNENGSDSKRVCCSRFPPFRNGSLPGEGGNKRNLCDSSGVAATAAPPMTPTLTVRSESWPIAGSFAIARGAKTEAVVVVAEVAQGDAVGRGECVPYARYGETVEGVVAAIEGVREAISQGLDRTMLQRAMPAGAARNALDCALWDLAAKATNKPVHALADLPAPQPLVTAYTISLG